MNKEVLEIKEFFEKEEEKNKHKVKHLVVLRDEIRGKNIIMSLENLILIKKLFPSRRELNFDTQAIHNFLLAKKSDIEFTEMLARFDKENNR